MNLKTKLATIATTTVVALGLAAPALAQDSAYTTAGQVVQEIKAGDVTYSLKGATLPEVTYNELADETSSGALYLYVSGNGNLEGWALQVQATADFEYVGASGDGQAIPAKNLSLGQAHAPSYLAGQTIDTTHGPVTTGNTGSLDKAQTVLTSEAAFGSGTYEQQLDVNLTIPKASQVGTYTGEVTVSTAAAPGTNGN